MLSTELTGQGSWRICAGGRTMTYNGRPGGIAASIGGAVGNAIDGFAHGMVVDFAPFHVRIRGKTLDWRVFNLADAAIVAGVAGLLYHCFPGVSRKSALIPADTDHLS